MKILFYVEPAVFRENPAFLSPHMNNVRCFINANCVEGAQFAIATSPALFAEYDHWLLHGGVRDAQRFEMSGAQALEAFGADRSAYARDLYDGGSPANKYLVERLEEIRRDFDPDLIVSPTQSRYLKECFPRARTAFYEVGPIPRRDGRPSLFFDFGGHDDGSVLSACIDRIQGLPIGDTVAVELWNDFKSKFEAHPAGTARAEFRRWRHENFVGKKVAIIAHSPPDGVSYDGSAPHLPLEALTADILSKLPNDWVAVPTYHRNLVPPARMEAALASEFGAFRTLPDNLKQFGSDPFISGADAVITVASKTALSAALLGKRTVSLGRSLISGMSAERVEDIDKAPVMGIAQAGRVLAFLSNAYVRTFEECFEQNGTLLTYWRGFIDADNVEDPYFDFSEWTPEHATRLLPVEKPKLEIEHGHSPTIIPRGDVKNEGTVAVGILDRIQEMDGNGIHLFNELLTRHIASKVIKLGDTVFDCGANHGYHTADFSERVGENGVVHAFEPNPELFSGLIGHSNVRLWPFAVGDRLSVETFILPLGFDQVGSLVNPQDWMGQDTPVKKLTVLQAPIDTLVEAVEKPVSFIKIDVERHEAAALIGLQETIRKYNPIIVYENNTPEIEGILGRLRYKVVQLLTLVGGREMPNVMAIPIAREEEIYNILPDLQDVEAIVAQL
ncbi:FkbM family methyltransferase [Ensifer adhaerens]|uniref:FkbM family methyltransferase n=1 Tax=Ensifer adhaerens TaxID=106592 RepID=UPI0008075B04|nr:FkbM family methyltransferase [Ensifer adhaerens]